MLSKKILEAKKINGINEAGLKNFFNFLNGCCLNKDNKKHISFLIDFLRGKHIAELSSRSYLLYGDPGIGKTYLFEKLLEVVNLPIFFMGCSNIRHKNLIKCQAFPQLLRNLKQSKGKCIIFLDDLNYILKYNDEDEIEYEYKRDFMEVLEYVKKNEGAILLATVNDPDLEEGMLDRIEVKIEVDLPTEPNKLKFLVKDYLKYAPREILTFLSKNSIGYNYRDLAEVFRLAYREGDGKVTYDSTKTALSVYEPTAMQRCKILNGVKLNFKELVGRGEIKRTLKRVIGALKDRELARKLGIKRANFLIFHGPPGTGKTFMAKALAGELGWPFITFGLRDILLGGPEHIVHEAVKMAQRFKNCVVFIDDAGKIIGRSMFGEDGPLQGALDGALDGIDGPIESLVILAMNNINNFGSATRDRFLAIEFDYPNYEERLLFLRGKIKKAEHYLKHDINIGEIARLTEKTSFREIEKIWDEAIFGYMENKALITTETVKEIIDNMKERWSYTAGSMGEAEYFG